MKIRPGIARLNAEILTRNHDRTLFQTGIDIGALLRGRLEKTPDPKPPTAPAADKHAWRPISEQWVAEP